jgi:myosin tail region-interacting protein MTI1
MSTVPFRVKALFDYSSPHDDDLPFNIGQIITVTEEEDDEWYCGEYLDDAGIKHEGIFPRNFVEKYEPTAPPRPTRVRTKKESDPAAPAAELVASPPKAAQEDEPEEPQDDSDTEEQAVPQPTIAPAVATSPPDPAAQAKPAESATSPVLTQQAPKFTEPAATSPPAPKAAPAQPKSSGPPPVSDKPTSNSFKDRIAAFNKAAAPPVAPFKPSSLSSGTGGFIKKPFVAPPPSRNAFVAPVRDVPVAKVYRRDEDPEIKEREMENLENAERAGLVPSGSNNDDEEDQPKPTSLKDRIALLQKQQMEQAQRHAEATAKKEKPKRPPKKRTDSQEPTEASGEQEGPSELREAEDVPGKSSLDEGQPPRIPHPGRRKSSRGAATESYDGNEADMSGAGDTTEGLDDVTERDESDERTRRASRAPVPAVPPRNEQADAEEEDEEEEDEEEDDVDPEVRRKEELRARMARLGGGMGMHGMFGAPPMVPLSGASLPPKKKKASQSEKQPTERGDDETSPTARAAPPVPVMIPLPGMARPKPAEESRPSEVEEPNPASKPPPPPARPVEDEEEEDSDAAEPLPPKRK